MADLVQKVRTNLGDVQIDYNALANLPSNYNLLMNSDFRNPVNQRGLTTYNLTTWKYSVDRWRGKNVDVVVNDNSITITATGTDGGNFQQVFDQALPLGDYIVSTKVVGISGNVYLYHSNGGTKLTTGVNTRRFTSSTTLTQMQLYFSAGAQIEIEWMKLEAGTTATPFVPKIYAEEVVMCQRYYRYFEDAPIYAISSDSLTYFMPAHFGVPMRVAPTAYLRQVLNSSGVEQTSVTLSDYTGSIYNVANIKLSKSIGQYGYVTMAFDAEIY